MHRVRPNVPTTAARASVAGALVLSCLAASPAAAQLLLLAGETTLVGSAGGVIRVQVPAATTVSFDPFADVVGTGDFVGFALSFDPVVLDSFPPFPPMPRPGTVFAGGLGAGSVRYTNYIGSFDLEPGGYLLYLLADGSPARVTLHASGLPGAVEVAPSTPASYQATLIDPLVTIDASQSIYSGGSDGTLTAPGLGLTMFWFYGPEVAGTYIGNAGAQGVCLYNYDAGDDPPDESVRYLPGCPWLEQSEAFTVIPIVALLGVRGLELAVLNYLPAGRFGQGMWYATATPVEEAGALAFWLSLEAPDLDPVPVAGASWGRIKARFR